MNDLINDIFSLIPSEIKDNLCFNELKKQLLDNVDEECEILFSEDIIKDLNVMDYSNIGVLKGDCKLLFSLEKEEDLIFTITKSEQYDVNLTICFQDENIFTEDDIRMTIKDGITFLKHNYNVSTEDEYYLDYKTDYYKYDSKFIRKVILFVDQLKDNDFIEFFSVESERVRDCRLHFKENIEYINCSKVKGIMKTIDEAYMENGIVLSSVMQSEEIFDKIIHEELEDEIISEDDIVSERLDILENMLRAYIGYDGEFVFSYNLLFNIRTYLRNMIPFLSTNGIILRKLGNEFTIFQVYFAHENLIVISKDISKEEARNLYESYYDNETTPGLKEFFEIIKEKRKDK